ncbi:MAG: Ribosomal protein [Candidatus Parcubacteria bacterium]|jgi:ribosomal protein L35
MKTNKSYTKRIRVTKNGKMLARKAGHNHFNAKESRRSQISSKNKMVGMVFTNKTKSRYSLVKVSK